MKVVPLEKRHLEELAECEALGYLRPYVSEETKEKFVRFRHAFAAEVNGKTIAAAGLLDYWPHRAEAWAFFDPKCKEHFLLVHKAVKRFLDMGYVRRVEAVVEKDFEAGHRWIKLLGFQMEAETMRSYTIEGKDVSLYALIKG